MKIKIEVPNQLIKELHSLVKKEGYVDLCRVFPEDIPEDLTTLTLEPGQACRLRWAADIERSRVRLKYPYGIKEQQPFEPKHKAYFDDAQDFCEKVDHYMSIGLIKSQQA